MSFVEKLKASSVTGAAALHISDLTKGARSQVLRLMRVEKTAFGPALLATLRRKQSGFDAEEVDVFLPKRFV